MELFIYKTNVASSLAIRKLQYILDQQTKIIRWSVDVEDVDKVLKLNVKKGCTEIEFIQLLQKQNIDCRLLD